jgi:hypothetical protein
MRIYIVQMMWWSLEALPQVMPAAWRRRCLCCLLNSGIYSTLVSEINLLFHTIFFNLPDLMLRQVTVTLVNHEAATHPHSGWVTMLLLYVPMLSYSTAKLRACSCSAGALSTALVTTNYLKSSVKQVCDYIYLLQTSMVSQCFIF